MLGRDLVGGKDLHRLLLGRCNEMGESRQSAGKARSKGVDPAGSFLDDEITNLPMTGGLVPQFVDRAHFRCHREVGVFPIHVCLLLVGMGLVRALWAQSRKHRTGCRQ